MVLTLTSWFFTDWLGSPFATGIIFLTVSSAAKLYFSHLKEKQNFWWTCFLVVCVLVDISTFSWQIVPTKTSKNSNDLRNWTWLKFGFSLLSFGGNAFNMTRIFWSRIPFQVLSSHETWQKKYISPPPKWLDNMLNILDSSRCSSFFWAHYISLLFNICKNAGLAVKKRSCCNLREDKQPRLPTKAIGWVVSKICWCSHPIWGRFLAILVCAYFSTIRSKHH